MRALIVTNMYPTPQQPAFGSFVRDQVEALRRTNAVRLDVEMLPPGSLGGYLRAAPRLRRRHRFDVVHAHFGLSAWPSLAVAADAHVVTLHGTDLAHPRSRLITLSALPFVDLIATVSAELGEGLPRWVSPSRRDVLPCGIDMRRFRPVPRARARAQLRLDPGRRYLLFPADPRRPEKRFDRARALAADLEAELLALGAVEPDRVPLYVNAADAVVVTSEREGFGLGVLEALACNVPVFSTPVGVAPDVLADLPELLCAPFALALWRERMARVLEDPDPRIDGRAAAERLSSDRMALKVLEAWRRLGADA